MPCDQCVPPSSASIARAVEALERGQLAVLPTDTVYGLFADIRQDAAVEAIATAKQKPPGTPLQLLFPRDAPWLSDYVAVDDALDALLETLGPGAWSIVAKAAPGWSSPALAGGRTVGFRIPDAPVVEGVSAALVAPLVGSSANLHGAPDPVTCSQAIDGVGVHASVAIDTGPAAAGIGSTLIDLTASPPRILREGAIDHETVARILGLPAIEVVRSLRGQ